MIVIDGLLALPSLPRLGLVALAAFAAGIMNAIAGGGTLLTFPALIGLGVSPIVANATSTVALWPGALGSLWGYRRELEGGSALPWAMRFALPSLLGGALGAFLLLRSGEDLFAALAPWLVLAATLLFMVQAPVMRWVRLRQGPGESALEDSALTAPPHPLPSGLVLAIQFLVAVYGGYFGAGIGILMLATLGLAGFTNIHRMNGLKNWGGLCINVVAALTFAASGLVNWPVALAMAGGATLGGYTGSGMAQRVSQATVRRAIVAIGLGSALWLLARPV